MTVDAELLKGSQQLEYFVCIEGIGWPQNGLSGDLSDGFNGDIFATNDIAGTLATDLAGDFGLTVRFGLNLPSSVSESIDPRTCEYSPSGLSFTILDCADFLIDTITPRKQGAYTTAGGNETGFRIHWQTVDIILYDGTAFDEGDKIWLGGRELVRLGAKSSLGGTIYLYSASQRGYLGTQRGSSTSRPEDYCTGVWPNGVTAYAVPWWWFGRKVSLWAHVPGEASENCSLRWYGKLRPIKNPGAGIEYRFDCVGDFESALAKKRIAVDVECRSDKVSDGSSIQGLGTQAETTWLEVAASGARRLIEFYPPGQSVFGAASSGLYELAAAYQYRNVPGGIHGMVDAWDAGSVQARDVDAETNILWSYVWIENAAYLMLAQGSIFGATAPTLVAAKMISQAGESRLAAYAQTKVGAVLPISNPVDFSIAGGSKARFLLDNISQGKYRGRFNLWGNARHGVHHTRHPIDVALMFMLSRDSEILLEQTGAGSTASLVVLDTAYSDQDFAGYALFSMEGNSGEGTAPEMEAATILSHTDDELTLDTPLSAALDSNLAVEIRNSIYDVLPMGWGMGIDARDIDIGSFERIRDEHLPDATLGDFILGVQDELDIWALLKDNVFKPYGILVYFDYVTRKISARYIGMTAENGTFESYTAVERKHIIEPGDVTHMFSNPVGEIKLTVRSVEQRVVGATSFSYKPPPSGIKGSPLINKFESGLSAAVLETAQTAALLNGRTFTFTIRSDENNIAFSESDLEVIELTALLNTEKDVDALLSRLLGLVSEYSVPPPVWETFLDIELYQSMKPGSLCIINWNDFNAPANPFTGNRGWTDIIGRVVSREYPLSDRLGFNVTIELLEAKLTARIAPAVTVTGKGSDGLGAYFTVDEAAAAQEFVADPDNDKDFWYFAVGDEIEHRDATGAVKASWANRSITGFGTDERADPTTAPGSPMRIYLDGAIGSTVAAGDYITFTGWPTAVSSRRSRYSSYADADQELGPDGDPARVYA